MAITWLEEQWFLILGKFNGSEVNFWFKVIFPSPTFSSPLRGPNIWLIICYLIPKTHQYFEVKIDDLILTLIKTELINFTRISYCVDIGRYKQTNKLISYLVSKPVLKVISGQSIKQITKSQFPEFVPSSLWIFKTFKIWSSI